MSSCFIKVYSVSAPKTSLFNSTVVRRKLIFSSTGSTDIWILQATVFGECIMRKGRHVDFQNLFTDFQETRELSWQPCHLHVHTKTSFTDHCIRTQMTSNVLTANTKSDQSGHRMLPAVRFVTCCFVLRRQKSVWYWYNKFVRTEINIQTSSFEIIFILESHVLYRVVW